MPDDNKNKSFNKIYFFLWGICIFVGVVAFTFYKFGFRLTNRLEPVKVGAISLYSNESDLQIFLDNREQRPSFADGGFLIKNVTPGLHSLIVSKDGFWPWAKTFRSEPNSARSAYAFIFPVRGLATKPVLEGTVDYTEVLKNFRALRLPERVIHGAPFSPDESLQTWLEKNAPDRKISKDGSTALYAEDNTVYVAWISDTEPLPRYFCQENPCKLVMPVTVSVQPLKSVDFYKERRDVLLFGAGTTIYGIEVDQEGTQNFQPLFTGTDPYFYQAEGGTLYIKDGNSVSSASL